MKKIILGIIIGFFLSSSLIYAATYLYDAEEVSYTPSDTSWKVSTVDAALNDIKAKSGSALTNLKNTNIAKAVGANGSTLTDVISKLSTIANRGNLTKTINPGGSVTLSAGYYSGGKITANPNQNSGTYNATSRSKSIDMGANNTYRYINTNNVPNTNSATYTVTSNGTIDMGANNTYRYINANVNSSMNHIYDSTSDGETTKSWTATTKSFVIASGATLGTNWSSSNELNSLAAQISSNLPLCATLKNTRPNNGTHAYACKVFCGVVNAGTTVTVTSNPYGYGATSVSIEAYAL